LWVCSFIWIRFLRLFFGPLHLVLPDSKFPVLLIELTFSIVEA
jgi:hypothetical protein